jgi:threonine/homoserine/homoserine lactone efflux protein
MPVDQVTLAAFVVVISAVVISPGPDTMLILRTTMTGGQRAGLATVAGVQAGLVVHTTLAVLGLTLVIASSPALFKAIAVAGALYLAWLAIEGVRAGAVPLDEARPVPPGGLKAARDAMLTNLLNPKVILVFLALMPNFVNVDKGRVPLQLAILGVVLILVNIVWQVPLSLAAEGLRRWIGTRKVHRAVNWGSGAVLMLFAAALLHEHIV